MHTLTAVLAEAGHSLNWARNFSALSVPLLAAFAVAAAPPPLPDGSIGKAVFLKMSSEGILLATNYPRGDFEIEFEVACNQPGSVFDTVGLNAAPIGAWSIVIAADYHLSFNVWDGRKWNPLVTRATLSRGTPTVVKLVRQGATTRFSVGGKEDASLSMTTPLSGRPVFVGDFKGDEAWGAKYTIHQGLLGSVKVLYLDKPRPWEAQAKHPEVVDNATPPTAYPSVHMTHSSGTVLDAPVGTFTRSASVKIDALDKFPPMAPFVGSSPVYRISAFTLVNPPKVVTLQLPSGPTADRAVVLAWIGPYWLRIPSEEVVMPGGERGQKILLDGVPLPWVVTVANVPEGHPVNRGLIEGNSAVAVDTRLDQLMWTDQARYRTEVNAAAQASLDNAPLCNGAPLFAALDAKPFLLAAVAAGTPKPSNLKKTGSKQKKEADRSFNDCFRKAKNKFHEARASIQMDDRAKAFESYKKGLISLWDAKNCCNNLLWSVCTGEDEDLFENTKDGEILTSSLGSGLTDSQVVEYYCGRYAPWGLELMLTLFNENGLIDGKEFDIRVLPIYGSLDFVDVDLRSSELVPPLLTGIERMRSSSSKARESASKWEVAEAEMAKKMHIPDGKAFRHEVIRFYSPRVFNWSIADIAAKCANVKELSGYCSALLALAKLSPCGAGASTAYEAGWLMYEVSQPIIEKLFLNDVFEDVKRITNSFGVAVALGYEAHADLGGFYFANYKVDAKNVVGLYLDTLLAWASSYQDLNVILNTRNASAGCVGYQSPFYVYDPVMMSGSSLDVPPIMLVSSIWGPAEEGKSDPLYYPRVAHAFLSFSLDYVKLAANQQPGVYWVAVTKPGEVYDLHRSFNDRREISGKIAEEKALQRNLLLAMDWNPFDRVNWQCWYYDSDPIEQQIAFRVNQEQFRICARNVNLTVEELAAKTSVEVHPSGSTTLLKRDDGETTSLTDLRMLPEGGFPRYSLRIRSVIAEWRTDKPEPEANENKFNGPIFLNSERPFLEYTIVLKYDKDILMEIPVSRKDKGTAFYRIMERKEKSNSGVDRFDLGILPIKSLQGATVSVPFTQTTKVESRVWRSTVSGIQDVFGQFVLARGGTVEPQGISTGQAARVSEWLVVQSGSDYRSHKCPEVISMVTKPALRVRLNASVSCKPIPGWKVTLGKPTCTVKMGDIEVAVPDPSSVDFVIPAEFVKKNRAAEVYLNWDVQAQSTTQFSEKTKHSFVILRVLGGF